MDDILSGSYVLNSLGIYVALICGLATLLLVGFLLVYSTSRASIVGRTLLLTGGHGLRIAQGRKTTSTSADCFLLQELSIDRKSTRLNSSHRSLSRMPSSA